MLVRANGLAETMSRYLILRIENDPAITLHANTEIVALEGKGGDLERVRWRNKETGAEETPGISHIFVMTGAISKTGWLGKCVVVDAKGFIKSGPDLSADDLTAAHWPLKRLPHLLETNLPGVFAVGDVRRCEHPFSSRDSPLFYADDFSSHQELCRADALRRSVAPGDA